MARAWETDALQEEESEGREKRFSRAMPSIVKRFYEHTNINVWR